METEETKLDQLEAELRKTIELARRAGHVVEPGGLFGTHRLCLVGAAIREDRALFASSLNYSFRCEDWRRVAAGKLGISLQQLVALEIGFDGKTHGTETALRAYAGLAVGDHPLHEALGAKLARECAAGRAP